MLNSLMCLDFYKDLQSYINESHYSTQSVEVSKHLQMVDNLIQQHGLYSLDFDTDRIQALVESIQDYVRVRQIEKNVVEINISEHDSMQVKVTKVVKQ